MPCEPSRPSGLRGASSRPGGATAKIVCYRRRGALTTYGHMDTWLCCWRALGRDPKRYVRKALLFSLARPKASRRTQKTPLKPRLVATVAQTRLSTRLRERPARAPPSLDYSVSVATQGHPANRHTDSWHEVAPVGGDGRGIGFRHPWSVKRPRPGTSFSRPHDLRSWQKGGPARRMHMLVRVFVLQRVGGHQGATCANVTTRAQHMSTVTVYCSALHCARNAEWFSAED